MSVVRLAAELSSAPFRTSLLTESGHMTKVWVDFFENLLRAILSTLDALTLQALTVDPVSQVQEIADLASSEAMDSGNLLSRVAQALIDLENSGVLSSEACHYIDSKVQDIEKLTWLFLLNERTGSGGGGTIIEGTHADRLTTSAGANPNCLFWETDRTVFYLSVAGVWKYAAGTMYAVIANLPGGLGADDAGFEFHSTDTDTLYYWDSANWIPIPFTMVMKFRTETTGTTLTADDFVVSCNIGSPANAVLPTTSDVPNRIFIIKNNVSSSAVLTVTTTGGQTIDGLATVALAVGQTLMVQSIGGGWAILADYVPAVNTGAWTTYTATITPSAGTWTASSQSCAYQQSGKTVFVRIRVTGTPSTTPASISVSLPVTAVAVRVHSLSAIVDTGTPIAGNAELTTTTAAAIRKYDASNFASVIQDLYATGVYEAA